LSASEETAQVNPVVLEQVPGPNIGHRQNRGACPSLQRIRGPFAAEGPWKAASSEIVDTA